MQTYYYSLRGIKKRLFHPSVYFFNGPFARPTTLSPWLMNGPYQFDNSANKPSSGGCHLPALLLEKGATAIQRVDWLK